MQITLKMLKGHGACVQQRREFRRLFGTGGTVTLARLRKAHKAGLDIHWAAYRLLPDVPFNTFCRLEISAKKILDRRRDKAYSRYGTVGQYWKTIRAAAKAYNERLILAFMKAAKVLDRLSKRRKVKS